MTVLKGIPRVLPPRLLHVLASMGHGDELVGGHCVCIYIYTYMHVWTCVPTLSRPAIHLIVICPHCQVLADANFPAAAIAHHTPGGLVNCDGTLPWLLVCGCASASSFDCDCNYFTHKHPPGVDDRPRHSHAAQGDLAAAPAGQDGAAGHGDGHGGSVDISSISNAARPPTSYVEPLICD